MTNKRYSKEALFKRAGRAEERADALKAEDEDKHYYDIHDLYAEANRLRQWAEFGCLPGRPDDHWHP